MKKFEIVSGHACWGQKKLFDEKTGDEKSRHKVLLNIKESLDFPDR
jgi:hypothetical protein